ncbi:cytochrome C biogenesis protein [Muribacter muris]|uniref:Cytochrome C biogenesis protein n=1 Tax=Muribacter muris TaxID=67855 RepID=A0A4Y9JXY6_9PAST|nr:cytochrome C biogenesis protein [Muribacter muris]MBF0785357.1 cytochrome C biogenesis protein [Muribacter muris]MBF0826012.1 cytochrome C biogenesis protein [Muribacter muris]TFV09620.1 cytochrome C biogenesis protein [Muribacter muris]
MPLRDRLNQAHYQQAVRSARFFEKDEQQAWLAEVADRHAFEQAQQAASALQQNASKRPLAKRAVWALAGVLLLCSGYYWQTGRLQIVQAGQQAFSDFQQQTQNEDSQQRNDHYIVSLQNQLRQDVNNGELWLELGQAYSLNNEFESALICFDYARRLLGAKPAILGAMASADYYQHKQTLTPQGKKWIEQALLRDPKESTSLLLLASNAFLHNQFSEAIGYWEQVLESENPAIDRQAIIKSIKMAQQRITTSK